MSKYTAADAMHRARRQARFLRMVADLTAEHQRLATLFNFEENPTMAPDPFAGFGEPEPLTNLAADFLAGMAEPDAPFDAPSDTPFDAISAPVGALVEEPAETSVKFPVVVRGSSSVALLALYEPSRRVAEIIEALEPVLAPPPIVANLEALVLKANALVVTDAASYQTCCELYELLAANEKGIEGDGTGEDGSIGAVVAFFHRPWKAMCNFRARFAKPVAEAKQRLSTVGGAWKLADDRRVEREKRLAEDKAAADERARLQAIADQARAQGDTLTAAAAVEAQAEVVTPALPRQAFAPAIATTGTKSRQAYEAVMTDEELFYKGLADGTIPRCAVLIDQSYLNRQATDLKEEFAKRFPGMEARKKGGLTAAGNGRRR